MGACGAIPLLAIFIDSGVMVALLAVLSGLALTVEVARLRLPALNRLLLSWLRPLLKQAEGRRITGATHIAVSALVAFLVFDKPVAITALLFLALGDPVAAMVGSRVAGFRVLDKSPLGTLAFVMVSVAVAGVLAASDVVSFHWGLVVGAAIAGLIELAPSVVDDNLTIPLISGMAMTFII